MTFQTVDIPIEHRQSELERYAHLLAIAANSNNEQIAKLLSALEEWFYPEYWADMMTIPPSGSVSFPYHFPGVFRLSSLELQTVGATYPSQVDVTFPRFSMQPFSLSAASPKRGPYRFNLIGSETVTFTNLDGAVTANVYIEWEMVKYAGR